MRKEKGFFRNMFDAMVEGRARGVEREIEQYRKAMRVKFTNLL